MPFAKALRGRHLLVIDLVGIVLAAYLALALRFDRITGPARIQDLPLILCLLLTVRTTTNIGLGLYSRRWRFASVSDLEQIVLAVVVGSLVSIAIFYGATVLAGAAWAEGFPRSFWLIEALLITTFFGGLRFGVRAASDLAPCRRRQYNGSTGDAPLRRRARRRLMLARSAVREPEPESGRSASWTTTRTSAGGIVAGLRVFGGLAPLERAVAETGAQTLLITMPGAPGSGRPARRGSRATLDLDVRTVPSLHELLDGSIDAYRLRRVKVEDLLGRPIVTQHAAAVEEIISARTVLITGAGGSIGSELARQVFAIGPRRLVLVDRAESPLYLIQRELEVAARSTARAAASSTCTSPTSPAAARWSG